jgi:hypothetical protein
MLESQIKVGVAIATSGSGTTNLHRSRRRIDDSTPMGVLQMSSHLLGTDISRNGYRRHFKRLLLNGTRKSLKAADILKY